MRAKDLGKWRPSFVTPEPDRGESFIKAEVLRRTDGRLNTPGISNEERKLAYISPFFRVQPVSPRGTVAFSKGTICGVPT